MNSFFDFSFSKFLAPKIIGAIYFLAFVVAGIISLVIIAGAFGGGFMQGIGALVGTPIIAALYLLFIRMGLESLIASIKTAENTAAIKDYLLRNEPNEMF